MSDRCTRCHGAGWLPADRAPKPGTQVPFVPCDCDNGRVGAPEGELVCVNGHDRCFGGPVDGCPYCERR